MNLCNWHLRGMKPRGSAASSPGLHSWGAIGGACSALKPAEVRNPLPCLLPNTANAHRTTKQQESNSLAQEDLGNAAHTTEGHF